MRDTTVREGVIPIYAYGGSPARPSRDIPTIATRMLIVAHQDTDEGAVRRLLEIVGSQEFARAARLPDVSVEALGVPELPLHDGARAWQRRNDPLFTPEIIDNEVARPRQPVPPWCRSHRRPRPPRACSRTRSR